MLKDKELCTCGQIAVWNFMPSSSYKISPYYCDDCVPRGCSCNNEYITEFLPSEKDGVENVNWKYLDKEKTIWTTMDEKGREFPCCEFDYDKEGFEI